MMRHGNIAAIVAVFCALTSLGCGAGSALTEPTFSEVTVDAAAWDGVSEGMSMDEVKEIMGEPSHMIDTGISSTLAYETTETTYTVNFQDDGMTNKTKNSRKKEE